jgi:orotidine-5'-phosphate decarboxylase
VRLQPTYVSIHSDGDAMMRAAVEAANDEATKLHLRCPKILGVTKLTSLDATQTEIVERAHRIMTSGLDGVIASPRELKVLRSELGTKPILLTPGIRIAEVANDDQRRTATPREAIDDGANIIVVGRPITQAADHRAAVEAILGTLR